MQRELLTLSVCAPVLLCVCHRCVQGCWTWEGSSSSCSKPQCTFQVVTLRMRYPWGMTGICILLDILRQKKQQHSFCKLFV